MKENIPPTVIDYEPSMSNLESPSTPQKYFASPMSTSLSLTMSISSPNSTRIAHDMLSSLPSHLSSDLSESLCLNVSSDVPLPPIDFAINLADQTSSTTLPISSAIEIPSKAGRQ